MASTTRTLSVSQLLRRERSIYLESCASTGGTASGFREWIKRRCEEDPRIFPFDGLRDEAATKAWETQPRKGGPDLFSINGVAVQEFMVRPSKGYVDGDFSDELFEKVDSRFATVADYIDDATIKLRKAAQASAAAEAQMQSADEARRRARGDLARFLRDLKD